MDGEKRREREKGGKEKAKGSNGGERLLERELLELLIIRIAWRGGDIYAHKRRRYISST